MSYIVVAFLVSFLLCFIFIKLNLFLDVDKGVQKFHKKPVPRIGGLAIYLSLLAVFFIFFMNGKPFAKEFLILLLCAFPVFFFGLLEDITKKVSPKYRLFAGFVSGALAFFFANAKVTHIDVAYVDDLFKILPFSLVFTAFAIAGVSHAFNIIDGFNGLVAGVSILVFTAYAYVSFLHQDYFLLYLSLVIIASLLGFFVFNYPFGFIFLGDGGAYLLGFFASSIGAILVNRHPDVSPWFPLLLVIYPVWETIFSIYRKKFLRNLSPFLPDKLHFHMLIYKRITKFMLGSNIDPLKRNAYTSPFLWTFEFMCFVPAVLFWNNTYLLMFFVFAFITFYTWLYFRIIRFKLKFRFK